MKELYREIWDEQIGSEKNIGFDFSGREIRKNDYENPLSKYGWTLLPFGSKNDLDQTFLVVHNKTMEEFPENINGEFYINGKIFEVIESKSRDGVLDINQISYETNESKIRNEENENLKKMLKEEKNKQNLELNKQVKEIENLKQKMNQMELEHQNKLKTMQIELNKNNNEESSLLKNFNEVLLKQKEELQNLKELQRMQEKKFLDLEKTTKLNLEKNASNLVNEKEIYETIKKEIELKNENIQKINEEENFNSKEIEVLKQKMKQIELEHQNELKTIQLQLSNEILSSKILEQKEELQNLKEYQKQQESKILELEDKDKHLNEEVSCKEKIAKNEVEIRKKDDLTNKSDIENFNSREIEILKQKMKQMEIEHKNELKTIQLQLNNELLSNKLLEQKEELQNLKEYQKQQESKILELEKEKTKKSNLNKNEKIEDEEFFQNEYDDEKEDKNHLFSLDHNLIWEKEFGNQIFANDFAGLPMIKSEYQKNVLGGWGIDYYNFKESNDFYISSLTSIQQRSGNLDFTINDKNFRIIKENKKWIIIDESNPLHKLYSKTMLNNEIEKNKPNSDSKKLQEEYESYSSLLINLNHFPIDYLKNFENFLKNLIVDLPIYKKMYIYLNKNAYETEKSNITSYARVFFKSSSIKDDIEILFTALTLKKAMTEFVNNYRSKNNKYIISFSMVITNHQRKFKFIQAQTNYDILKSSPVPLKIPVNKLILDEEYNSILKFHENELWKKLRPLAIDYQGNAYYVCDVDPDDFRKDYF